MGRFLGIDYGKKRIGLALSDILGMMSHPFDVIESKGLANDVKNILKIAQDNDVSCIVVGIPVNMNATEGEMSETARKLTEELKNASDIKIETIDERLTTVQAERLLVEEADVSREKRKNLRDKIAASFILQTYLDIKSNA